MTARQPLKMMAIAIAALLLCGAFAILSPSVAHAKNYNFQDGSGLLDHITVYGVKKGKVTYNKKSNTLTLKNAHISNGDGYVGIMTMGVNNIKLKLVGKNTIKSTGYSMCIFVNNLSISGKGSLKIINKKADHAITCSGDKKSGAFTLNSGTVTISSSAPGITCKNATIKGGKLTFTKAGTAIQCKPYDNCKKSTISHNGGTFTAKGGKVILKKVTDYGIFAEKINIGSKGYVSVSGTGSYPTGLKAEQGAYSYGGKTWQWGGTILNKGTIVVRGMSTGVSAEKTVTNYNMIDCRGNEYGVNCSNLDNHGTINGTGCTGGAFGADNVINEGTVIE